MPTNMPAPPAQMQQKPVRMEMPPNIQPKAVPAGRHHSNILPSSTAGSGPGSSVSTQTTTSGQERVLDRRDYEGNVKMFWKLAGLGGDMSGSKARSKPGANRGAQGGGAMKADAANQMKQQQQAGSQPSQIMKSILTNNPPGVPNNQLPPLVHLQGNMVMTGGEKPMMTAPSPQMMGKLMPVPMQQQMHLVPQQSVQPLQQQHRMPNPGDSKPMMSAAVMQGIPGQGMMMSPAMSMHPQMSAMASPPPTNMVPAGMHLQQGEQQMPNPPMTMVANSMQSDPSFGLQQNVVQPMEVVENSDTQNAAAEDKTGEETGLDDAKDKGKLKAMVKPQVMTHMIEGFMILEEPFTKSRSGMSSQDTASPSLPNHISDKENQALNESCELATKQPIVEPQPSPVSKCENCGKVDPRAKFKKSKRCCSPSCASSKRMTGPEGVGGKKSTSKQGKQDWNGLNPADTCGSASAPERSLSPSKAAAAVNTEDSILPLPSKNSPDKWNVSEVCEFIRLLPGCSEYAEDFAIQEIDGQALMLLKADHLMAAMSIKLGPALKICAKIDQLKSLATEDK
ncbi:hypothetical protein B566_EDAN010966 [Ephemera danica]|nr:hypothetical protein B566_EDAN010966 [Ephemera danica]